MANDWQADGSGKEEWISKVPQVTLAFWIIKILATTLGETGGDAVTMSMNLGYLIGTAIFAAIFIAAVIVQVKAKKFHPVLYWTTIVATTTVGTTMADYADRSLGVGYMGGSAILFTLLMASLFAWYRTRGGLVFGAMLAVVAGLYFFTKMSRTVLFWAAFILTRPLGAVVGDFLDKPVSKGGLELSRYSASAALLVLIVGCIFVFPRRAAEKQH